MYSLEAGQKSVGLSFRALGTYPFQWVVLEVPRFFPGTPLEIICPISNLSDVDVKTRVQLNIHQGSWHWEYTGDLLASYTSPERVIEAGGERDFVFEHTTIAYEGRIDRDLHVTLEYWDGNEWQEWDKIRFTSHYEVEADYEFHIGTPVVREA